MPIMAAEKKHIGKSLLKESFDIAKGVMRATTPRIMQMLNRSLPRMLPSASSVLPFNADVRLTVNSGADVPTPMITAPITNVGIPKRPATATPPLTRNWAPTRANTMPIKSNTISIEFSSYALAQTPSTHAWQWHQPEMVRTAHSTAAPRRRQM